MYLAIIEPNSFMEFPNPVPFNVDNAPVETGLLNETGKLSGRAQAAVRPISSIDFNRILELGLRDETEWPDRYDVVLESNAKIIDYEIGELDQATFERPIIEQVVNRKYRDAKFKLLVRKAYDRRCAFTGLRLINGKGRPEVEAAHIRPVSENGPDSIKNGIALSGTVHWMFDRGMLSLGNDFEILHSRQLNYDVSHFLLKDNIALVPKDARLQPHPDFLSWHRENVFKQ